MTDERVSLGTHTLVGRSPESALRLSGKLASSNHALVVWSDGVWQVRDIGSRNGTWLEETRLEPGAATVVPRGGRLAFGDRRTPWVLEDDSPPGPAALRDDGELAIGEHGLLALPDPERPLVTLLAEDGRWLLERAEGTDEAANGVALTLEGRRWTLLLPRTPVRGSVASTLDATGTAALDQLTLRFSISQDEEHVDLTALTAGGPLALGARSHHFLLLALARARQADARADIPEAERGWLYVDDLCRMLRVDPSQINLHLYRARQQLAAAGVEHAAQLVERRRLSRQLRLGLRRVEIWQAGAPSEG